MTNRPIKLDLARDLPKVRKAYGRLLKRLGECSYSSPCAIGAMMTPAQRKRLMDKFEDGTPIDVLIQRESVAVPNAQAKDFLLLQEAFDHGERATFDTILETCERKYVGSPA